MRRVFNQECALWEGNVRSKTLLFSIKRQRIRTFEGQNHLNSTTWGENSVITD